MSDFNNIINLYAPYVVQIATPYATGTGFYLPQYGAIVTNHHVIEGNAEVVIQTSDNIRFKADVILIDKKYDVAILQVQGNHSLPTIPLPLSVRHDIGQQVVALGHPYGMSYTSTYGIISNTDLDIDGISYLIHDAALNPGHSGGPLVNIDGQVTGINTSIFREGRTIGVALKVEQLVANLEHFIQNKTQKITICPSCRSPLIESHLSDTTCNKCGARVDLISSIVPYQPTGVTKKLESIISEMGYDVLLCRKGQNTWEMHKGSALLEVTYHTKSSNIVAESCLCLLPENNIIDLYEFILRENYKIKGLTFNIKGNKIYLSLLIHNQQLDDHTTKLLLQELVDLSDYYDDLLVNKFQCQWINQ